MTPDTDTDAGVIAIACPPSKSVSHRAAIVAALAWGTSNVTGLLESQDLERTRACLAAMGARIAGSDGAYRVTGMFGRPVGGGVGEPPVVLDMGESGTSCRLLAAVAAAGRGTFEVRGAGRMHDRPIGELTRALETLGAKVEFLGKPGCPPLLIETRGLSGGLVDISLEESSQYLSGLLLAAPLMGEALTIQVTGKKAVSWPYVAVTLAAMAESGVAFSVFILGDKGWTVADWTRLDNIEPGRVRFQVNPGRYLARDIGVEGDWSNASYFLAAGALGRKPVRLTGLRRDSLQGDTAILDILERMGATATWDDNGVTVAPSRLKGLECDMGRCPDLAPTVAVAASLAQGQTVIRNVAHLRIKESDRLAALADNIARVGATVETLPDGLRIEPGPDPAGQAIGFASYDDHRMAMSMSLYDLAGVAVSLDNPGCVAKSFPGFWDAWARVKAENGR